jgi:4-hydroxy-2-oxoheptanedioate aldolase
MNADTNGLPETERNLRRRLRCPEPFLALFSIIPAQEIVEIAAIAGFDGVILDTEHGSYGSERLPPLILAARARGIHPIVRVRHNEPSLIGAALDAGAHGVLVPQIGSGKEAMDAVSAARFAPKGTRGANPWVRAADYGADPAWFEKANEEAAVLLMVEGPGGADSLDAIMATGELDAIFLGPVDLSHSLGVPGQIEHPKVVDTISRTIFRSNERRIAAGVFTPSADAAKDWIVKGARFVAVGVDTGHVKTAFGRIVKEIRGSAESRPVGG